RQVGDGLLRKGETHDFVGFGNILVVELAILMISPEACPDDCFSQKRRWRPSDSDARVKVTVSRAAKTGANAAEAGWTTGCEVKGVGAAVHFVKDIEKTVARTKVQGQSRRPLEFILKIAEVGELAQPVDGQGLRERSGIHIVGSEGVQRGERDRAACGS